MDEADSLDALANLLTQLSTNSYDVSLHAQHIRLSQSLEGMESQVTVAQEMITNYLAAGDEVWIPLIDAKTTAADLDSPSGALEVLEVYSRAEADYLSIPILQKHVEFLIDRHAYFTALESKPDVLGELFSTDWTRSALTAVVTKGAGHITQSHLLWDVQRDWELDLLENAPSDEKAALATHVEVLLLSRLQQPHSNHEETYQAYSTFTTNYQPPDQYESLLVSASKLRSQAVKAYERRENSEISLRQSGYLLDNYAYYIASERRARNVDIFILQALYERAIAEAARRRFAGEPGAEDALRAFWAGYSDTLRVHGSNVNDEFHALRRATRSVPGSGEVWARYIRFKERTLESEEVIEDLESVTDAFTRAISTNLFDKDVQQTVQLILAVAGFEKRRMEAGKGDDDVFVNLIKILEDGMALVRKASPTGDPQFRLEKFLAELYLSLASLPESAIAVWQSTAKHNKTSYVAWTAYTDVLIKTESYDLARTTFQDIAMKNIDWPEAIWEAWIAFEHLYGSVESIEAALDKVERARYQVNARRAREAEKAVYEANQVLMEHQAASVPVVDVINADAPATHDVPMDVDASVHSDNRAKRKAEEPVPEEGSKKPRLEPPQAPPPQLKRDRENCTVFVADLPGSVSENELKELFKDCGEVREVKVTQMPEGAVATVEFNGRDSIPAALTKDKKRISSQEVAVHLAWKSTLYVTNFPEKLDDASIRDLFGQYGLIFDVRWPSKKFKSTRRFCYVQYTVPSSAERALGLHGRELEPDRAISVLISNPERKKERSDADAGEREIYVAGLSKFTTKEDLENVFKTYGSLKEVRMAQDPKGQPKGFAFVEFEDEASAQAALGANNYELKNRRIAVTLADTRVRSRNRDGQSDTGLGRRAEARNRSVRVRNLPPATQEGLLHQALEKYALVKRTELFISQNEAIVELENPAEAGKLLLRTEPIIFNGNELQFSEESIVPGNSRGAGSSGGMFIPRSAKSRPRAGIGRERKPGIGAKPATSTTIASSATSGGAKGQDDFRKMLG
ncbi:hypothetical protein BJ138DRAFT_1177428 [Hygrophoropsis aurantiaca]|uniref:Uncharacterized protein n=1 Tax=Hygrophoropsis aurantiaca TaxID=72124 RepID=A0ACB8AMM9_9AGAM|nr:hypothetical protein BJ138DRAFT_1177428 [Hygrophoropsis aurantiaca]